MQGGQFNFYQTITGLIFPVNSPVPFGLFYINDSGLYGVYFPQDIALGAPLHLLNDGDISPTTLSIQQSGYVDKELKDIVPFSSIISGDVFPSSPDSTNLIVVYNGNITGSTPDNVLFNVPWSGNEIACPLDITIFYILQKGNVQLCPQDNFHLNLQQSGNIITPSGDINNLSIVMRGDLIGGYSDKSNVTFDLYSISFAPGLQEITINTGDLGNVSFIINTISFKRAE